MEKRIDHVDILKAFGILMMVMGHIHFGNSFYIWIHSFHMPLFFVISGYFYKQASFRLELKKSTKSLLVPYITFGVFHILLSFILYGYNSSSWYILFYENTQGIPIGGALWFLTALFFTRLTYNLVVKINTLKLQCIIICIISIGGMILATYLPFRLPLAFDAGMIGVGFYHFGRQLRGKWHMLIEQNLCISFLLLLVFTGLGLFNGLVNLRSGKYANWLLFWLDSVGIIIALWNLARIVDPKITIHKEWVLNISKYSIVYVCMNQVVIFLINMVFSKIAEGGALKYLLSHTLTLILTMLILYGLSVLITRTKLKFLIGK